MIGPKKYRVNCPISNRPENVYMHILDYKNVHLASFSGCDTNYHACPECEHCEEITRKLHDQECDEVPQHHLHTPE